MDGMVKVRSEYLREEAALLSEECEQALAQYQETVERFMALAITFERTKWFAERLFQIAEYYEQAERGNVDAAGMD